MLLAGTGQVAAQATGAARQAQRDIKPNDTADTLRPGTWQSGVMGKSFNAVMNSRLLATHPAEVDTELMSGHREPGPLQQLPLRFTQPEFRGLVTIIPSVDRDINIQQLALMFPTLMLQPASETAMRALMKAYLAEMLQPENARIAQAVLEAPVTGESEAITALRAQLQLTGTAGEARLQFDDERLVALRIAQGDQQVVVLIIDHAGPQD